MAASRWMFTKEQLLNTPSRKSGIDADKELSYRQQGANLIQDMGQRLSVTQLCINTAIVYMHRFYMFQSFTRFPRNEMAPAALFLAAKVEEQPRKLEHVIKVAHSCLHRDNTPAPDTKSDAYLEQAQQLVINENILLQTLGFEVTVDHPHTHIVKATNLVKATKDLAQTSYFLATNSLHMTTFSLQYRPTIVACCCIYLACKWSNWKIPRSNEGREWFQYVDRTVTSDLLEELYTEFLAILEKYPHKLRKKIMGWKVDKDGNACEEETTISFDPSRRHRPSASTSSHPGSSQDKHRPGPSSSSATAAQHKLTNHDRKDPSWTGREAKDSHTDPKQHSHDHRKHMGLDQKDGHGHSDKKHGAVDRRDASDATGHSVKKEFHPDSHDKMYRKDGHGERKDSQGDRKEVLHQHQQRRVHGDHRERGDRRPVPPEHRGSPVVKTEPNTDRSYTGSNLPNAQKSKVEFEVGALDIVSVKKEPGSMVPPPAPGPTEASATQGGVMRRVKSDVAINYKDYLKRKEQEKLEREKMLRQKLEQEKERERVEKEKAEKERAEKEKERAEKEKERAEKEKERAEKERERAEKERARSEKTTTLPVKQETVDSNVPEQEKLIKQTSGTDLLNKSIPHSADREKHREKHRPPKLDIGAHIRGPSGESRMVEKDHNERPYEVNIKSPVKPHYNITVKSPIKSSDLKRPRLELNKVDLAPDKAGSDSCSVNINSDSHIKKMVETNKPEPSVSNPKTSSHNTESAKVKIKVEPPDPVPIKSEKSDPQVKVKQERTDSQDTGVDVNREYVASPVLKVHEAGTESQNGSVAGCQPSQGSLKISIKQEPGSSGRSTPVISQPKSDTGSGSNTPLRTKIILPAAGENSPLKLKISTKSLHPDLDISAEKHKSPHRHHKHKDKHKSHKHSKDREKHRERHREKHREKHGSGSSSGTNGHGLKMSIKLSDIQGHSSSSNDSWVVKQKQDKHRHKTTVSESSLSATINSEAERQQPWSMSDLSSKSKSSAAQVNSPARKRRRTPTVDVNNDSSKPKSAKTDSRRLRRSSSSHSVVSMEMSDGEEGQGATGAGDGLPCQPQVVNQLQEGLKLLIEQTKRGIQKQQNSQQTPGIPNTQGPESKRPAVPNSHSGSSKSKRPTVIDRQQSGFDLEGMMWSGGASSDVPPLPPQAPPPLPRYPPTSAVPPPPPE